MSSQVGCTLTCTFCHTGTQRLVRNLTAGEIVGQVLIARDSYGEWPTPRGERLLSNIVLMGMGEPLFNYDNVAGALRIIMDPEGIAISRRRITLSTSGVVPMIPRVGAELGVKLAISLHAATDELRDELVPINKRYPIAELMRACREYPGADNARRITFEYVMLKGVNDSPADAKALARLVAGIPAKFNLIPFNAWPGAPFECSSDETMRRFAGILNDAGYTAPVRTPRGRDIMAACGQLRSASERQRSANLQPRVPAAMPEPRSLSAIVIDELFTSETPKVRTMRKLALFVVMLFAAGLHVRSDRRHAGGRPGEIPERPRRLPAVRRSGRYRLRSGWRHRRSAPRAARPWGPCSARSPARPVPARRSGP